MVKIWKIEITRRKAPKSVKQGHGESSTTKRLWA